MRGAFAVDRVSLARIDLQASRFEIAAERRAPSCSRPGTELPVSTCSYFAQVGRGPRRSTRRTSMPRGTFDRPLDSIVLAHRVPLRLLGAHLRDAGRAVGALSLSADRVAPGMTDCAAAREAATAGPRRTRSLAASLARRARVRRRRADAGRGIARLAEQVVGARAADRRRASMTPVARIAGAAPGSSSCARTACDGRRRRCRGRAALRAAGAPAPLLVAGLSRRAPRICAPRCARVRPRTSPRRDAVSALRRALARSTAGSTVPRPCPVPPSG